MSSSKNPIDTANCPSGRLSATFVRLAGGAVGGQHQLVTDTPKNPNALLIFGLLLLIGINTIGVTAYKCQLFTMSLLLFVDATHKCVNMPNNKPSTYCVMI